MLVYKGHIYVSHREKRPRPHHDARSQGRLQTTIAANLPAQGDYSVTDMVIDPAPARLFFGVGSATNSGVGGLDNWEWIQDRPAVHDVSWAPASSPRLSLRFAQPVSGCSARPTSP